MNSPYQEVYENQGIPESWDLWSWYEKHNKSPNNHTITETFLKNAVNIICLYLLEQQCQKYIQTIELSAYLEWYRETIDDILHSIEVKSENKWLKIYIWKSLNHEVHSCKVKTYDYVFSILWSQDPIPWVVYLQDFVEKHQT